MLRYDGLLNFIANSTDKLDSKFSFVMRSNQPCSSTMMIFHTLNQSNFGLNQIPRLRIQRARNNSAFEGCALSPRRIVDAALLLSPISGIPERDEIVAVVSKQRAQVGEVLERCRASGRAFCIIHTVFIVKLSFRLQRNPTRLCDCN